MKKLNLLQVSVGILLIISSSCTKNYDKEISEIKGNLDQSNYDLAAQQADKVLKEYQSAELYNLRGVALFNLEEFEKAKNDYLAGIKLDSSSYKLYYNLGKVYQETQKDDSAVVFFTKALKLNPSSPDILNNRGLSYYKLQDSTNAVKDFTDAISLNKNMDAAHYNRGNIYKGQGKLNLAVEDFKTAIRINPNHFNAYFWLGKAYQQNGDKDSACSAYLKSSDLGHEEAKNAYESECK